MKLPVKLLIVSILTSFIALEVGPRFPLLTDSIYYLALVFQVFALFYAVFAKYTPARHGEH